MLAGSNHRDSPVIAAINYVIAKNEISDDLILFIVFKFQ